MSATVDPLLVRLGIDPKRFRLLLKLFHTLSKRREVMNQHLGMDHAGLAVMGILYGFFGALLAVAMVFIGHDAAAYLSSFVFFTALMLLAVVMAETANTLVNPEEGLVLVHQPINGATYTAAKLVHLARVVGYVAGGLNAIPAVFGLYTVNARFWYPAWHMICVLAAGIGIALGCCALFGWMMRYVPPARMKAASQVASGMSFLILMPQFGVVKTMLRAGEYFPALGTWPMAAMGTAAMAVVVLGLRALSADYLIQVTRLVQGGSRKRSSRLRVSPLAALAGLAALAAGGPAARAGFAYLTKMAMRDWQFRRHLIGIVPLMLMVFAGSHAFGSPFQPDFSMAHGFPHLLGMLSVAICSVLKGGSNHEATWLFRLASSGSVPPFTRGMCLGMWAMVTLTPHLPAIPAAFWLWGPVDAAVFMVYSLAISSLYLSVSLAAVNGLPFGHRPGASQTPWLIAANLGGFAVAGAMVALQHYVLFRSYEAVLAVTLLAAAAAYWSGRSTVRGMAAAIEGYLYQTPGNFV